MNNEQIDRELLEAIKTLTTGSRLPSSQQILSRTSVGQSAHWKDELWRIRLLAQKGMVKILGDLGDELAVRLDPRGEERLSMTEDDYQRRKQGPSAHNTTKMEFHNSTVGNVSQVSGSYGVSIDQTNTSNDLQQLSTAIDRLMGAVKASPSLSADVKKDAQIEADQLKGEVQKSKPNPNRIQQTLDWFKALDTAATVVPHLLDVADKLKHYFPGVL